MPYCLKIDRPLIDAVIKEGDKQLGKAAEAIGGNGNAEEAVFDFRKRMKKVRGLLRLVRPGLEETYQRENKACRDLARQFSEVRDSQILPKTVARLKTAFVDDQNAGSLFEPLEQWAESHRRAVLDSTDLTDRREKATREVGKIRRRFGGIDFDCNPQKALRKGVAETYSRAADLMMEALLSPDAALLHEWRKRLKYHWYHMRLLRDVWPESMDARIDALDRLTERLGTHNDLAVLMESFRRAEPDEVPAETVRGLELLMATHGTALRTEAIQLAPRLLVEDSKAHGRRMAGLWRLAPAGALSTDIARHEKAGR